MQRNEIDIHLRDTSFEYFYWYSRFEFALKENGFLKRSNVGDTAEPCWSTFQKKYEENYEPSEDAIKLIILHPKRQIVGEGRKLLWRPVGLDHCKSRRSLGAAITMLNTIRNNLFHGGKHGDVDVDDKNRNLELLTTAKSVLDQLAVIGGFESDYIRFY